MFNYSSFKAQSFGLNGTGFKSIKSEYFSWFDTNEIFPYYDTIQVVVIIPIPRIIKVGEISFLIIEEFF